MPVDLDKIRALLASVAGFTPGGMHVARGIGQGATPSIVAGDGWNKMIAWGVANMGDATLFAAAPDLHRELTEAVGEIERLRLIVGWAETDALGTSNALALVTEQAKKDCAERDAEIERLRAHNARMVAAWLAVAERADKSRNDPQTWCLNVAASLPGHDWEDVPEAIRRLAAGEVDDG